jgi:hypothetical protein
MDVPLHATEIKAPHAPEKSWICPLVRVPAVYVITGLVDCATNLNHTSLFGLPQAPGTPPPAVYVEPPSRVPGVQKPGEGAETIVAALAHRSLCAEENFDNAMDIKSGAKKILFLGRMNIFMVDLCWLFK